MKTYRNLFGKISGMENLLLAFRKAKKRKSKKVYIREFEKDLDANLVRLHHELIAETYTPLPLRTFILRVPKTRKICVSDFRDRIIHHAICNVLEPIYEKYFILDSYANRKGKGVLAAVKRFDEFKRKVTKNGHLLSGFRDGNRVRGYALKIDIKQYFENVDQDRLMTILQYRIKDARTLNLIKKIIQVYHGKQPGKGMPLGNLTSQFLANVYMNEIDHFTKQILRVKYYLRYVDDIVILHQSKETLVDWAECIEKFLCKSLLLEMPPQKSRVIPLSSGVDLLGFKCWHHFSLVRKKNVKKIIKKIKIMQEKIVASLIPPRKLEECWQGWIAYAMHANSAKCTGRITKMIKESSGHGEKVFL